MFTRIVKMEFKKEKIPTFLINFEKVKEKIRAFEGCSPVEHLITLQSVCL